MMQAASRAWLGTSLPVSTLYYLCCNTMTLVFSMLLWHVPPAVVCAPSLSRALKEAERKTPGFQRLRMAQYDDLRKKLISSQGTRALKGEVRLQQLTLCLSESRTSRAV